MAKQLRKEKSLLVLPVRELRILLTPLIHGQVVYFRQRALLKLESLEYPSQEKSTSPTDASTPSPQANKAAVRSYMEEVFEKTGKRIKKIDIWKSARYRSRTEFERWERNDPRATKTAHERFSKILAEKPHLKPVE